MRAYADLAKGEDLNQLILALYDLNRALSELPAFHVPEPVTWAWVQREPKWEDLYRKIKMYGDSVLFYTTDVPLKAYTDILKINGFRVISGFENDPEAKVIEALHFKFLVGSHLGYH